MPRFFVGRTICAELWMTGGWAGRRSTTWGFAGRLATSCCRCLAGSIRCMCSRPRKSSRMPSLDSVNQDGRPAKMIVAPHEFADHKYVMVLHDHQANPHVHLSVRAESRHGKRLSPRKADLSLWRQVFAENLRGWGVEAEASTRAVRGQGRTGEPLWRLKAREEKRLPLSAPLPSRASESVWSSAAKEAWARLASALTASRAPRDRKLAAALGWFDLQRDGNGQVRSAEAQSRDARR